MHFHGIPLQEGAGTIARHQHPHPPPGRAPHGPRVLSRRQFAATAAGTALVGATLGAGGWRPRRAQASPPHEPVPIPGGSPGLQTAFGHLFHVFGPGPAGMSLDPIDAEPITITDFNGFVGLAYLNGTVRQINTTTGEMQTLPFLNSDMRFMQGVFRDTEGELHHGAFALVWFDVFDPSLGDPPPLQIHDLNPGIQPDGLFWTTRIPSDAIHVDLRKGFASMEATDLLVNDYVTGANALGGGGPPPQPCVGSFKVVWSGVNERLTIRNDDPVFGGFAGEFVRNTAQVEWRANIGDLLLVSDLLATSSSSFAEIGSEQNGSFFS